MKAIALVSLLFLVSCASPQKQNMVYLGQIKTSTGYTFTGTGQYWQPKKAQELSESDLYGTFSRFMGETIIVDTVTKEREIVGSGSLVNHSSSIRSYGQIELPPDVRVKSECQKIKDGWKRDFFCISTMDVPFETLATDQQARRERTASEKKRALIRQETRTRTSNCPPPPQDGVSTSSTTSA